MRRVQLLIRRYVPDDFVPGQCAKCPFKSVSSSEPFPGCYQETIRCKLGYTSSVCPLEYIDEEKPQVTVSTASYTCKQCKRYKGCIYLQYMDKQSHQDPCGYFESETTK